MAETDDRPDAEPDVVVQTTVAAPADRLYAMVSDVTRMGEWSPETAEGVWRGGATGPEVGARFAGRNRLGWRRWSTSCRVVEADPGRAFAFDVTSGPLRVSRWAYRFEPAAEGTTTVTEEWTDHRGRTIVLLGGVVTGVPDRKEHNRASMEQTLAALKEAAEAE